jgi:hypothetical protein
MKALFLTLALSVATAGAASAAGCDEDLKKLDAVLSSGTVSPDLKAQAEDMRNQAQQLCDAGNEEEGEDVLAEAAALLGIE